MDEHEKTVCDGKHKSIECVLSAHNWVFGIIITIQLSFCSVVGWLCLQVNDLSVNYSSNHAKLETIDRTQQQVLTKLESNSDKLTSIAVDIGMLKNKPIGMNKE